CGIYDGRGDPGFFRLFNGTHKGLAVERCKHYPIDALTDKSFDNLYLLLAVVFAKRAFPNEIHVYTLRLEIGRGLHRPGIDAFPKWMCRSFWNHCDGEVLAARLIRTTSEQSDADRDNE